jgi:PadR family transcriptional regulator, regulatory protein PadR
MPRLARYGVPMSTARKDSDFLNGVPELLLLLLLARRPMYGYELGQGIRLSTGGAIEFGEGCIYPILHRLEAEAMILGTREKVGGRSRVVYRITPAGRGRLAEVASRWEAIASAITRVLEGDGDAAPALG